MGFYLPTNSIDECTSALMWAETEPCDLSEAQQLSLACRADAGECEPASSAPRLRPLQVSSTSGASIAAGLVAAIACMAALANILAGWAQ